MRLLFICVGNINRSPAAELICKTLCKGHEVKSAAINQKAGRRMTKKMAYALDKAGYDVSEFAALHRSSALTEEHLKWADRFFVMDRANSIFIYNTYPKYRFKMDVIGVRDPHFSAGTVAHETAVFLLEQYMKKLCAEL